MHILITGGAGFVGSNIALALKSRIDGARVTAFDNLHRRGSERTLSRLKAGGVEFIHGDVRQPGDLAAVGPIDFLVECSAEPSVQAVGDGQRDFLLGTNLTGALHCAELCLKHGAGMLFVSTSRVYPIEPLVQCRYTEGETRLLLADEQAVPGVSAHGVAEDFPIDGPRSFYGATKYAAEVMLAEYAHAFDLPVVLNRCGVIAGPWQFGKVDQGVTAFWVIAHMRQQALKYIGFGGTGKQVRDILHVADLTDLVELQVLRPEHFQGQVFNVGGGEASSVSLQELTTICEDVTGNRLEIGCEPETRYADVPIYITDNRRITAHCGWQPSRDVGDIVRDVHAWLVEHPDILESL